MKKSFILLFAFLILFSLPAYSSGKIRIGVYDSRMIAIANFQSEEFQKEMKDLRNEFNKAKEKKDTAMTKKLEEKGQLIQKILHDKGFGRGSVVEIIEKYPDVLKELATKEKLTAIVSKWELNYSSKDVQLVDITVKLMSALKYPEKVIKMYDEAKKNPPIKNAFFLDDND